MTEENTYPKKGDYKGWIRWAQAKNPNQPIEEIEAFARKQVGYSIATNHMQIRVLIGRIRELLQEMEDMANELV